MTKNEFEYVRLTFQLHKLIAEGKGDGEEADAIRDKLDYIDEQSDVETQEQIRSLSSWCYALTEKDEKTAARYRRLLFEGIWE